ncbi:DUF3375 family protein [Nonomuraea sp. NPDC050202]|uniref:DUF3375 family protein n=1 Tax=Nonomuraea sp. NPDC050202 TaxID=3155035 RepID=UPI0033FA0B5D
MAKSAENYFHEFTTNAAADAAMSLLRSSDAMVHVALMAAHLGDGQIVDGMTLVAAIGEDLLTLPVKNGPADGDRHGEAAAESLLRKWTKKGWVHRSLDPTTRLERYQLASGAAQAVRQMRSLRHHTSIATESALSMVMAELRQIAVAANPDPGARKKALNEQIAMLSAQREELEAGAAPEINLGELVDKVAALAQLIERIPTDVARYGEHMHANTAALLRQSLTGEAAEFAETLINMFDGHDVIAASPEGQAFRAFATLLGNPTQRAQLESDINEILLHVQPLPAHLAHALTAFIDTMWERMREVEDVRKGAFRRISNFVRGGDARHYRSMRTRITEAQAAASRAFQTSHSGRDTGFPVPMSPAVTTSVGRLRLNDGAGSAPDPITDSSGEFAIEPEALAAREAIDWIAVRAAVHAAMDAHGGYATLPEVMAHLRAPRTGDVIAIWHLAARHGIVNETAREHVWAHTNRGMRELIVPYIFFGEELPAPIAPAPRHRHLHTPALTALDLQGATDG